MKPYPIRLPESLIDELEEEADELGLGTAEYARQILRQREYTPVFNEDSTQEHTLAELAEKIDDLDDRLGELEAPNPEPEPEPEQQRELDEELEPIDEGTAHAPIDDAIAEVLDGWRPGRSSGPRRQQRREAGRAALDWLRGRAGGASAQDFQTALYGDYPVDEQDEATWWRNTIRPVLKRAENSGLVEYQHGRHEYQWVSE